MGTAGYIKFKAPTEGYAYTTIVGMTSDAFPDTLAALSQAMLDYGVIDTDNALNVGKLASFLEQDDYAGWLFLDRDGNQSWISNYAVADAKVGLVEVVSTYTGALKRWRLSPPKEVAELGYN